MAAPTVTVTATTSGQDGLPIEGATVTMVMDRAEFYQGFVVKESVSATTNASGVATLDVFPNELGSNGSQYKVTIITPEQTIRSTAVVPNSNCNLHDIMQVPPYPAISLSQQAMTAAQNYAAQAGASAATASGHAVTAGSYAGTASGAATLAQGYAISAAADAATASNASISATAAKVAAEAAAAGVPVVGSGPSQIATNLTNDGKYALKTTTINGQPLSSNVSLSFTASDVGLGNVSNVAQMPSSYLDTDGALAANSDTKVASQKAVKTYVDAKPTGGKWTALASTTDFSTTAASTSTITMNVDWTSTIKAGMAIRFTLSGTTYYAICTAITSNLLTIAGAPLTTTASALTALSYGLLPPIVERIAIPGYWADAADTALIANDLSISYVWRGPKAYLVQIGGYVRTTDSGASKPRVNARIGSTTTDYVSTSNSNAGLEMTAATTWYRTGIDIATATYAVSFADVVELKSDGNGSNDDSSDLFVELVFVVE